MLAEIKIPEVGESITEGILVAVWRGLLMNHFSGICSSDLVESVDTAMRVYVDSIRSEKG